MPRRDVALALLVILIWGVNFVAANIGMEVFPPLLLAALRFTLVAIPAVFIVKPPGNGWRTVVAVGVTMGVLQFGLLYTAMLLGMPAGLASLVLQVQTVFTVVFASVVLGERPRRMQMAGIAIGVLGMAIVAWQYVVVAPALPFLLTIAAAASWASGNVLTRRRPPRSGFSLVVWSALVAPLPLLGLSLLLEGPDRVAEALANPTWPAVVGLGFVAYGASMVGYGIWNLLLSRHAAGTVAPWSMLVPVVGAMAAWLYNGELPTPAGIVGGAITVVGVLLALGVGVQWLRRGRAADDTPDREHPASEPPGL
ncbi:MAG: EamA family transporter [Actinomycetes bacterium]